MPVSLIHLAERFYNRPHLITPAKARVLLDIFARRQGFKDIVVFDADARRADPSYRAAMGAYVAGRGERRLFPVVNGDIAVITAEGTLVNKNGLNPSSGMTGYDGMSVKLNAAAADDGIRGILYDIDSCGGEVAGLFDHAAEIRAVAADKPVWAVATDSAYSAAYALAGACDRFYLPETGGCGSIGVVMMHTDFSAFLEKEGIAVTLIHAGDHKVDGNPYETLSDAVFETLQAECEAVRQVFARSLEDSGRLSAKDALATEARCYMGAEAVEIGLADGFMPAKAAVAEFIAFLDGKSAVAFPAATAAHLQPTPAAQRPSNGAAQPETEKEAAPMAKSNSRIPQTGRKTKAAEEDEEDKKTPDAAEDTAPDDDEEKGAMDDDDDEDEDEEKDAMDDDEEDGADKDAAARKGGNGRKASAASGGTINAATARQIVGCKEAEGHSHLANALAFAGVDLPTAKDCLAAAAKDRAQFGGGFRGAMAAAPAPKLGTGAPGGKVSSLAATAKRMADETNPKRA